MCENRIFYAEKSWVDTKSLKTVVIGAEMKENRVRVYENIEQIPDIEVTEESEQSDHGDI